LMPCQNPYRDKRASEKVIFLTISASLDVEFCN